MRPTAQHTCGGLYDLTCEACQELRDEYPGESSHACEELPTEHDVIGGL